MLLPNLVSSSKIILTHNIQSPKPIKKISTHQGNVNCAIWNHRTSCGTDGKIIMSHFQKGYTIKDYEYQKGKNIQLNSIAFSSNSLYLACGGNDTLVKVWNLNKQQQIITLKQHLGCVTSVTWNHNDRVLASSSIVGDIYLYNSNTGTTLDSMSLKSTDGFKMIKFCPNKKNHLAACTNDGSIMIWDINQRIALSNFNHVHKTGISAIAFSQFNPILLLSVSHDQYLNFYDSHQRNLNIGQPLTSLAISSDGHTVVVGSIYGSLMVFDLRNTNELKENLVGHDTSVRCIQFTRQQKQNQGEYTPKDNQKQSKQEVKMSAQKKNMQKKQVKEREVNIQLLNKINQNNKNRKQGNKNINFKEEQINQSNINTTVSRLQIQQKKIQNSLVNNYIKEKNKQQSHQKNLSNNKKELNKIPEIKKQSNDDIKKFIKQCITEGINKVKQQMNSNIQNLHIEIIRQLEIQQNITLKQMSNLFQRQRKLEQRIIQLKKDNQKLKKNIL